MEWIYKGSLINEVTDMPTGAHGFVYIITASNGSQYIGKKTLHSIRKRKFGKKESKLVTDKRKKLYEMVKRESDWKSYTGSNKELNEDIKNGITYDREILYFAFGKKQLSYFEVRELFTRNVLESSNYYNDNIQGTFFRRDVNINNE